MYFYSKQCNVYIKNITMIVTVIAPILAIISFTMLLI